MAALPRAYAKFKFVNLRFLCCALVVLLTATGCSDDEPTERVFEYPCNEGSPSSVELGDNSSGAFQTFVADDYSFTLREGSLGAQGGSGWPWIGLVIRAIGVPMTPNEVNVTVTNTTDAPVFADFTWFPRRDVRMTCDETIGWVYTSSIELPGEYPELLGQSIQLELSGEFAENNFDEVISGTLD